jgi:hypothetical protein
MVVLQLAEELLPEGVLVLVIEEVLLQEGAARGGADAGHQVRT